MRRGSFNLLMTDDQQELLAFARAVDDDRLVIAVNNADVDRQLSLNGMAGWSLLFVAGSAVAAQGDHYQLGPRTLAVFRTPQDAEHDNL